MKDHSSHLKQNEIVYSRAKSDYGSKTQIQIMPNTIFQLGNSHVFFANAEKIKSYIKILLYVHWRKHQEGSL